MADTTTPRMKPRPLSPHLQIYRMTLTMAKLARNPLFSKSAFVVGEG